MLLAETMFVTLDKKRLTHIEGAQGAQGRVQGRPELCLRYSMARSVQKFVKFWSPPSTHASGNVLRNDRNMYHIYAYLALLRLWTSASTLQEAGTRQGRPKCWYSSIRLQPENVENCVRTSG